MTGYVPEAGRGRFVVDLASAMNPCGPSSMPFEMSTYQTCDEKSPTAVLAPATTGPVSRARDPQRAGCAVADMIPGSIPGSYEKITLERPQSAD